MNEIVKKRRKESVATCSDKNDVFGHFFKSILVQVIATKTYVHTKSA